jgi:hypothetical protein
MPSRTKLVLCTVLMLAACAAYATQAPGQQKSPATGPVALAPIPPGAVVMIWRAEVKPGHSVVQQKAAAASARASAKIEGMPTFLAMTTVTGPSEVWFMTPFGSLAEIDKMYEAFGKVPAARMAELDQIGDQEAAHYNAMRGILVRYREDLSLDASFNVSLYRSMSATVYRVRPGQARQFAEGAKAVLAAWKKANVGLRVAGFEVLGGMPSGTFIFFRPMKLAADLVPPDAVEKAYLQALGPEAAAQMEKGLSDIISSEEQWIFSFSPKMSSVPASYAAADPFWRVGAPEVAKGEEAGKKVEAQKKPVAPAKK